MQGLRARRPNVPPLVLLAVLLLPLAVAAIALRRPTWYPVLDLAMTELRLRDVFTSHTPLIGLPGRIGRFPEQGSHPGPMSFYGLWPTWKALGSSAWGMQVGVLVMNAVAMTGSVLVARRRGGTRLMIGVIAVLAVLVSGYGMSVLVEPWNPYIPLLWWFLTLLCVWSVLCADFAMLPVAVVASSMAAQTHVPYLGLCLGVGALAVAWLGWSWWRVREQRSAIVRWGAVSLGLIVLLWSPLVVDQLTHTPGNLSMLWTHFTSPPVEDGPPVGMAKGVELALRHLDVTGFLGDSGSSLGSLAHASGDPGGSVVPGAIVLAVWAGAAVVAFRRRNDALVKLHVVVAAALALGVFSMSRIFGKVWYYLMLWAWGTLGLLCLAVVWTALDTLDDERARRAVLAVGIAVTTIASLLLVRTAADLDPPAPALSAALAGVVDHAASQLDHHDRYLVTWDDGFYIGSQGYGLVNELERRGFTVGVPNTWRVPVTHHRVFETADVDAEVKLAVGVFVDRWRKVPGAKELAFDDPRSPSERADYERTRARVASELHADHLDDVVPLLDGNLFGASLDPRLDDSERRGMEHMLDLGSPAAVFLVKPGQLLPQS